MPLFDLFKKSPKKEPVKDDPFGSPELQKKRYDAAVEFLGVMQKHFLSSDGKAHAGTVLSAAAWLAGTSLYRSLNYKQNPAPGTVVLSNEVNEAGPKLIKLFMYYLERNGTHLRSDQLILDPPDQHKPLKDISQIQNEFQDQYNEIMKKYGLDYLDGARAGMIVCSIVFQYHCEKMKDMDPRLGAGMISIGIITGAKTSPIPLNPEGIKPETASGNHSQNNQFADVIKSIAQNSTGGTGARLVLGEGMTPMQEALSNGGKYILVHPGVLSKLKESNIDSFLLYEAAMRIEIESKIPQIDFVGTNIDILLQEWSGKPEDQAPIHVRQMLWLRTNAQGLGYQQSGNSWVLAS